MRIDPYKHKERYQKWRELVNGGIPDISKFNSDLILRYLDDMESGINISSGSVKGARSYIRLNTLKEKMIYFSKRFKELYDLDNITDIDEDNLLQFFSKMRRGDILRYDGKVYISVGYYVKVRS